MFLFTSFSRLATGLIIGTILRHNNNSFFSVKIYTSVFYIIGTIRSVPRSSRFDHIAPLRITANPASPTHSKSFTNYFPLLFLDYSSSLEDLPEGAYSTPKMFYLGLAHERRYSNPDFTLYLYTPHYYLLLYQTPY